MKQLEIHVKSTQDGTLQPSLFYPAEESGRRPLLVVLHTWSCDRFNQIEGFVPVAEKYGFHLLLPEFRGPNLSTNEHCREACGSSAAKADILDAIDYVTARYDIDEKSIFLVGGSGGGHMAMLMAGYAPTRFAAIAAVVPISDLTLWKDENPDYRDHILACAAGNEGELRRRSPISYIDEIAKSNLKIFHGKWDNSVPVTQSIHFYNEMLARHPEATVYLDIFNGGHEMKLDAVLSFITTEYKKKNGAALTG